VNVLEGSGPRERHEPRDDSLNAPGQGDAVRLDRSSFVPLYYQLQEILKQQIESGEWLPGSPLPGEQALARRFGVSRVVVRQALAILADDRQIERIRGVGTFVADPKLESRAGGICRLVDRARDSDVQIRILQAGVTQIEESVQQRLRVRDEHALDLAFSVSVGTKIVAIGHSFFPLGDCEWIREASGPGEVLPSLVNLDTTTLGRSEISIEGSHCDKFEAAIFGVAPQEPVFLVHSLDFRRRGTSETPIEFARVVYRSDILQLRFELESLGAVQTLAALWSVT
jgi:DNA-binding GntR family transcriptional regulator